MTAELLAATLAALTILATPGILRVAGRRMSAISWVGPVVLCYAIGLILGRIPVFAQAAAPLVEFTIPLAIPLLLVGSDLKAGAKAGSRIVRGFVIAAICAPIGAVLAYTLVQDLPPVDARAAGMLAAVYTGGTPNLVSVGAALEVEESLLLLLNGADLAASSLYLLFVLTVGVPFARWLLGRARPGAHTPRTEESAATLAVRPLDVVSALLLAVVILACAAGLVWFVFGALPIAPVILALTTGALLASLSPRVRSMSATAATGDYLLLIFCVAIGARTDPAALTGGGLVILGFTCLTLVITVTLHFCMARLIGLDAEATLVSSTAAIFGPPFVPLVARRLGAEELTLGGLALGLMGYAVGTYIGLALAWALSG